MLVNKIWHCLLIGDYMTKRFTVIILSIVLCTSVLFVSCGYNSSDLYETQEFLMGTVVLQKIYHENAAEIAKEVMTE